MSFPFMQPKGSLFRRLFSVKHICPSLAHLCQSSQTHFISSSTLTRRGQYSFDHEDSEADIFNRDLSQGRSFENFSFDTGMRRGRDSEQERKRTQIDWDKENLKPFRKDFYQEHKEVKALTSEEVSDFRKKSNMTIFGKSIPKPFNTWNQSSLPDSCLRHISKMGIDSPTPIQQQGIPMALSGRDVVGISRTGSGKTLAYVLPAIVHIQAQPVVERGEGPIALVLCPTRELCIQIDNEIRKYLSSSKEASSGMQQLQHLAVYGGSQNRSKQVNALRYSSPDILVATPGRLIDLYESGETNFTRTTYVVLDEADRMLDMGFRPDLERILRYIRPDRQVLMWSATWPKEIQQISQRYMKDPLRVQIGSTDLHANSNIEQNFRVMKMGSTTKDKMAYLLKDVDEVCVQNGRKCLVFTNTKRAADDLEFNLVKQRGIRAKCIHGDKSQSERERILNDFKHGQVKCLIATDVVARGIDIRDIAVVLCFDFPTNIESYVHRIGRTGRGNDKGVSLAYLSYDDVAKMRSDLIRLLKMSGQDIPKWLGP